MTITLRRRSAMIARLALAEAAGSGPPRPVLKGEPQVGDQQFRNISFMDFGGD